MKKKKNRDKHTLKLFFSPFQQYVISFCLKEKVLWPSTFLLVREMKRYGDKKSIQMKTTTEKASGKSIPTLNESGDYNPGHNILELTIFQ